VPTSLALYSSSVAVGGGRDRPRAPTYDHETAPSQLGLLLSRDRVAATSRDGELAARPASELPALLEALRAAYPDDGSLAVGAEAGVSYSELLRAVGAARGGRARFASVALAAPGMIPRGEGDLGPLLRVLGAARVSTEPALAPAAMQGLRRCYADELKRAIAAQRTPLQHGTLALAATARGAHATGGTLRGQRQLASCVEQTIGNAGLARSGRVLVELGAPRQ
jgi:hypothetical protein